MRMGDHAVELPTVCPNGQHHGVLVLKVVGVERKRKVMVAETHAVKLVILKPVPRRRPALLECRVIKVCMTVPRSRVIPPLDV